MDEKDKNVPERHRELELIDYFVKQQDSIQQLRQEMYAMVSQLAATNTTSNVVEHGIDSVIKTLKAQLAPLRDLTPARVDLTPQQSRQLGNLHAALKRIDLHGVTSLSEIERPALFSDEVDVALGEREPPRGETILFVDVETLRRPPRDEEGGGGFSS